MAQMILIPLPAGFDASQHKEGETFDVTATVQLTLEGFKVEAIDGMPVETNEAPAEEAAETEMDEGAFDEAMGRGKMKMAEAKA